MAVTNQQERLLTPPRLERFCPGEHCAQACDARTCTCKPCQSWCPFCKARKAAGRRRVTRTDRVEIAPVTFQRQLRLISDLRPINKRSEK
jgi:hypothetical protein